MYQRYIDDSENVRTHFEGIRDTILQTFFYLFQSIGFINPPLSVCYINLVDFDTLTDVKRSIIRLITRTMKVGNASF